MGVGEGEAVRGAARRDSRGVTRQAEPGPKPGTYVITIEIPDIDPEMVSPDMLKFEALYTGIRNVASALFDETWVTFHRQMPEKGRHSGPINPNT